MTVGGTATLSSSGALVFTDALNDFVGALTLSAGSVTIVDLNEITIGSIAAETALTISAGGKIIQLGSVDLGSGSSALFSSSAAVELRHPSNDFAMFEVLAGSATLFDRNDFTLGAAVSVVTDLTVTAAGTISQSQPVTVAARVLLSAANAIVLTVAANDFELIGLYSPLVKLVDKDAVTLDGASITNAVTISAGGLAGDNRPDIAQTSSLFFAGGDISLVSTGDIVLTHADNQLGHPYITAASATLVSRGNFTLQDAISIQTALTVSAHSGNIGQSGALIIPGSVSLYSAGTVLLDSANNQMTLLAVVAQNATVSNNTSLTLGTFSIANSLTLSAHGDIAQYDPLISGPQSYFSSAGNIQLDHASNDFEVIEFIGIQVTLVDRSAITLGEVVSIDTLMTVSANGDIIQQYPLTGTGYDFDSLVSLSSTGNIVLNNANNELDQIRVWANNATLADKNDFTLGSHISVQRSLTISAVDNITQIENLTLHAAPARLISGASVRLTEPGNNFFGDVAIEAGHAILVDVDDFTLGADSSITGGLTMTMGGGISQIGSLIVGGDASLTSGGDITLDDVSNDWSGRVSVIATGGATLFDSNDLILGKMTAWYMDVTANNITLGDIYYPASASVSTTAGTGIVLHGNVWLEQQQLTLAALGADISIGKLNALSSIPDVLIHTGAADAQSVYGGTISLAPVGQLLALGRLTLDAPVGTVEINNINAADALTVTTSSLVVGKEGASTIAVNGGHILFNVFDITLSSDTFIKTNSILENFVIRPLNDSGSPGVGSVIDGQVGITMIGRSIVEAQGQSGGVMLQAGRSADVVLFIDLGHPDFNRIEHLQIDNTDTLIMQNARLFSNMIIDAKNIRLLGHEYLAGEDIIIRATPEVSLDSIPIQFLHAGSISVQSDRGQVEIRGSIDDVESRNNLVISAATRVALGDIPGTSAISREYLYKRGLSIYTSNRVGSLKVNAPSVSLNRMGAVGNINISSSMTYLLDTLYETDNSISMQGDLVLSAGGPIYIWTNNIISPDRFSVSGTISSTDGSYLVYLGRPSVMELRAAQFPAFDAADKAIAQIGHGSAALDGIDQRALEISGNSRISQLLAGSDVVIDVDAEVWSILRMHPDALLNFEDTQRCLEDSFQLSIRAGDTLDSLVKTVANMLQIKRSIARIMLEELNSDVVKVLRENPELAIGRAVVVTPLKTMNITKGMSLLELAERLSRIYIYDQGLMYIYMYNLNRDDVKDNKLTSHFVKLPKPGEMTVLPGDDFWSIVKRAAVLMDVSLALTLELLAEKNPGFAEDAVSLLVPGAVLKLDSVTSEDVVAEDEAVAGAASEAETVSGTAQTIRLDKKKAAAEVEVFTEAEAPEQLPDGEPGDQVVEPASAVEEAAEAEDDAGLLLDLDEEPVVEIDDSAFSDESDSELIEVEIPAEP